MCWPQAFVDVGMKWASYIVAAGAIMGIVTGEFLEPASCCCSHPTHYLPLPPSSLWFLCTSSNHICLCYDCTF